MNENDFQAYGRCPLGYNIQPSGTTGDNISTTQIEEGEDRPLYWSNYYQDYVCSLHFREVEEQKDDDQKSQDFRDLDKKLHGMGFK